MKKYDKLVRDKIPEIIEKGGGKCKYHFADDDEYDIKLSNKLLEEVNEFIENPSIHEMIDILETLESIRKKYRYTITELKELKAIKLNERGGFNKKIILDNVE